METNAIGLEIETCGRCGGSGSYSFNLMDGSRCYGCGGSGKKLTKRGAAARVYLDELQSRPVAEIKVGEFIWNDRKFVPVRAIDPDALNPGMVWVRTSACSFGHSLESKVRSLRDEAHRLETIAAAVAYQATLTKQGKPAKVAA